MRQAWRRALGLLALAGLVGLLVTWPGSHQAAAIGAGLVLATLVLLVLGRRRLALVPLAALALTTMLLQGSLTTWQAWTAPVLVALVLDALLVAEADPREAWVKTAGLAGGLALVAVVGWNWQPTRASLVGTEGIIVAIGLMGAAATSLVLWSTREDDEQLIEAG